MNRLRRTLEKRRMLFTMLAAVAALLLLAFSVNMVFYCRQAQGAEAERRGFLEESARNSLEKYDSFLTNLRYDTQLLFDMPGLSDFTSTGLPNRSLLSNLRTYIQSRYALEGIAYYQEEQQKLIGYQNGPISTDSEEAAQQALHLTKESWQHLARQEGFVFTQQEQQQVVIANRIGPQLLCLRTMSHQTLQDSLQFLPEAATDGLLPGWSLVVTDAVGQQFRMGENTLPPGAQRVQWQMENSGAFQVSLYIADETAAMVKAFVIRSLLYYGTPLLILGTILGGLFVLKLYRPVKAVLLTLPEDAAADPGDEHHRIQSVLRTLSSEQANTQQLLQDQQNQLQQSCLQKLFIGGQWPPAASMSHLPDRGLETYSVVQAALPGEGSFTNVEVEMLCPTGFRIWPILAEPRQLVLLVSAAEAEPDFALATESLLQALLRQVKEPVQLFSSAVHHGPQQANIAWLECLVTNERYYQKGQLAKVFPYAQLQLMPPEALPCPALAGLDQQIYQAMVKSQHRQARELFDQYCQGLSEMSVCFHLQKVQMVALLLRMVPLAEAGQELPVLRETELLALLSPQLSGAAFWERVRAMGHQLIPAPPMPEGGYPQHFEALLAYIQSHLQEENLCINQVAQVFGISASTLTRELQKHLGMGFSAYLHTQRLGKAKTLLETTAKPLKDVAAEVGYSNTLTMTRAFKKYEGTTPGAYRTTLHPSSAGSVL